MSARFHHAASTGQPDRDPPRNLRQRPQQGGETDHEQDRETHEPKAGLVIALLSPILGAIADASGRGGPSIAAFEALLVISSSLMSFGKPGDPA